MKKLLLICCLLLAATVSQAQSENPSFSLEAILSSAFPTDLVAAPTGEQVAWVLNKEGIRNIWMAKGPLWEPKQLTTYDKDDGQAISQLLFSGAETLVYIRGSAPNRQGEIPNPTSNVNKAKRQIWKLKLDGSDPSLLTTGSSPVLSPDGKSLTYVQSGRVWIKPLADSSAAKSLFAIRGRPGSLRWSPTGKHLAFVSNRGDHSFIGIYDFEANSIQYLQPSVDQDQSPVWSPDGQQLAFIRVPNEKQILPFSPRRTALPWSIQLANAVTGEVQELWKAPEGPGSALRFVSANNQLLWGAGNHLIFPWEGDGWTHLYTISTDGGEPECLTPGDFEVQFVSQSPNREYILYSSNQGDIDRQHIWRVPAQGGEAQQLSPKRGIQWSPVMTAGRGTVLCLASSGKEAAHVARVQGAGLVSLMDDSARGVAFPADQLVEPVAVEFPAADGMMIHGQLFLPPNQQAEEKRPAVLFFHGGSRRQMLLGFHHRGYYHNAYAMNQYLASQGYVVLSVNYRSGIGYGMEFREALNYGAQGASEYNDVIGAGLYLSGRADVDPDRIGLWGGSYGGYLTALGLAKASDLFAAGVDIHGVHDWNVVIRNFVPSYNPERAAAFAKLAYESSPMAFIDGWRSPVLVIHGDDDRNVPFSETVDLVEALRHKEVHLEQLIFPDEVHGFLLHKNWLAAYRATADFFDRMLKNKP
ncbi:MAG: prolyl oligopeptidase family serine peptidase [Saprospiraceae bacterium]|nr:prolyl oligopeptidase family serine peptidase [Saprospiraceae bacterium]